MLAGCASRRAASGRCTRCRCRRRARRCRPTCSRPIRTTTWRRSSRSTASTCVPLVLARAGPGRGERADEEMVHARRPKRSHTRTRCRTTRRGTSRASGPSSRRRGSATSSPGGLHGLASVRPPRPSLRAPRAARTSSDSPTLPHSSPRAAIGPLIRLIAQHNTTILTSISLRFKGPIAPVLDECRLSARETAKMAVNWHGDGILWISNILIVNIACVVLSLSRSLGRGAELTRPLLPRQQIRRDAPPARASSFLLCLRTLSRRTS